MNIKKLFSIFLILITLSTSARAFEENFQYYTNPSDISSNWIVTAVPGGIGSASASVVTSGATYSRAVQLYAQSFNCGGSGAITTIQSITGTAPSNYWSFVLRSNSGTSATAWDASVGLIDSNGNLAWSTTLFTSQFGDSSKNGLWELTTSGTQVFVRFNGADLGASGGAISSPAYNIVFWTSQSGNGCGDNHHSIVYDDITTSGYISGIGTDSNSHTLTESNLDTTNISFTLNTFPFSDYTSSSFTNVIEKYTGSTPGIINSKTVKNSSTIGIYSGFSNYNRSLEITNNDTNYGLYFSYLKKSGTVVATDYFFLIPPGASNSITTEDTSAVVGQTESITYSIGAPDFIGSSYSVNIYSLTSLITSIPLTASSGTVTWDTSGNSNGLYFIVLSKTTSGIQSDLAYTTMTLVSTLLIRGTVYDAQNATVLSGVNINISQGSSWFNTTSNATGNYNLSGLLIDLNTNINASKSNYTHNNFSFTPLAAQVYIIDLYLISNNLNCSIGAITSTCIVGMTESYPYHQAVPLSTVNLANTSYSATTTSNATTGFYIFKNLTDDNLLYTVNATKSGFQNSIDYNVTTSNGAFVTQIIIMYELYTLTIHAQDSTNANTILSFTAILNGTPYNTTIGAVTISNLTYNQYPIIVSSEGYLSSSQTVLVDSTKIVTFYLRPVIPATGSTVFKTIPHDVMFIVQDISFNKKSGIYVTAKGYNTTVGSWSWLAELIGIDFDNIPINNATMSGITGTDGAIDFKMDGSIYYIVTFSGAGISNMTWQGYPTQYQYVIIVPTTQYGTFIGNIDEIKSIKTTILTQTINSSTAKIYANYSDSTSSTTNITVYLNKSISGDPDNQTNIQTLYSTANSTFNSTFNISPYSGQNYIITFVFTHSILGTKIRSYGVSFPISSPISYFNPISVLMLIIALILFFAGFWGQTSTEQGAAIIVGLVWILSGMGLYASINLGLNFYLGLTLATVITILMNINSRARKEGMS